MEQQYSGQIHDLVESACAMANRDITDSKISNVSFLQKDINLFFLEIIHNPVSEKGLKTTF